MTTNKIGKNSKNKRKYEETEDHESSDDEIVQESEPSLDGVPISEIFDDKSVDNKTILAVRHLPIAYRLVYQVTVTLLDPHYVFWRMIVISGTVTLDNLHKILLLTMNWDDLFQYSFTTNDNKKIAKGARKGLSSVKTKFIDICPLPRDFVKYTYGKFNFNLTVDKVNAVTRTDDVPRCVDGHGGLFPETVENMESYIEIAKKIKPKKKAIEKLENVDLDGTNMRFYGKRFGKNTTVNKIPRQGPQFWHFASDSPAKINQTRMEIYKRKLD